jgi:putative transcriptional regulator
MAPSKTKDTAPDTEADTEGTRIVVKLDDLLYERRMTLTELAERIGITIANLSILKTGKAKAIRFSTLEAICRELGCQPGDLLGYDALPIES